MATPRVAQALCVVQFLAALYPLSLSAVPTRHLLFVLCTATYATFANLFILRSAHTLPFPPLRARSLSPLRNSARLLFPFTAVFSLLVPAALLAVAPAGLRRVVAPHFFLVLAQILCETVGYLAFSFFTVYVRLGVTIAFVAYRLPVVWVWYEEAVEWALTEEGSAAPAVVPAMAQAAAVLNLVYWASALLCYLLLYCVPAVVREPEAVERELERMEKLKKKS